MMLHRAPSLLTTDERFREIAAILAAGICRLRDRAALGINHSARENPTNTPETPLELSPETVLSVQRG